VPARHPAGWQRLLRALRAEARKHWLHDERSLERDRFEAQKQAAMKIATRSAQLHVEIARLRQSTHSARKKLATRPGSRPP
jgi:hypothetical protein